MSALLLQFWPYIAGVFVTLLAGAGWKLRQSGINSERAKQAQAEAKARDVKDQVQNDVGALPPDVARARLRQWSKS